MDEKGLVVKWMVDEAGRSALMSPIPLMICSSSGLAGSDLSVTGHVNVWQQDSATAHRSETILNLLKVERIIL